MSKISFMPWQNTESKEIERNIKKEVYALAKDRDRLLKPLSSQEFVFDFQIEAYVFVACVLLKYDSNLVETRESLVPKEISEEEFWCNYFYSIECIKAELGLPTRLGDRIDHSTRQQLIAKEDRLLRDAQEQVEARATGSSQKVSDAKAVPQTDISQTDDSTVERIDNDSNNEIELQEI